MCFSSLKAENTTCYTFRCSETACLALTKWVNILFLSVTTALCFLIRGRYSGKCASCWSSNSSWVSVSAKNKFFILSQVVHSKTLQILCFHGVILLIISIIWDFVTLFSICQVPSATPFWMISRIRPVLSTSYNRLWFSMICPPRLTARSTTQLDWEELLLIKRTDRNRCSLRRKRTDRRRCSLRHKQTCWMDTDICSHGNDQPHKNEIILWTLVWFPSLSCRRCSVSHWLYRSSLHLWYPRNIIKHGIFLVKLVWCKFIMCELLVVTPVIFVRVKAWYLHVKCKDWHLSNVPTIDMSPDPAVIALRK